MSPEAGSSNQLIGTQPQVAHGSQRLPCAVEAGSPSQPGHVQLMGQQEPATKLLHIFCNMCNNLVAYALFYHTVNCMNMWPGNYLRMINCLITS